jgi:hypothetical protein
LNEVIADIVSDPVFLSGFYVYAMDSISVAVIASSVDDFIYYGASSPCSTFIVTDTTVFPSDETSYPHIAIP